MTAHIAPSTPIPALITVRPDRSFTFTLRTPPTSTLLLTAAGVAPSKGGKLRGANAPGRTPTSPPSLTSQLSPSAPATKPGRDSRWSKSSSPGSEVGKGTEVTVAKEAGGSKAVGEGGGVTQVGEVSLKHVYEIAQIKATEERLAGVGLKGLCRSVLGQARSIGVGVVA